jgi:hypothetical protein
LNFPAVPQHDIRDLLFIAPFQASCDAVVSDDGTRVILECSSNRDIASQTCTLNGVEITNCKLIGMEFFFYIMTMLCFSKLYSSVGVAIGPDNHCVHAPDIYLIDILSCSSGLRKEGPQEYL